MKVRLPAHDDRRRSLRVLLLEDRGSDAELLLYELKQAGFDPIGRRVETEAEYLAALDGELDVILADFNLPTFDAFRALELLDRRNLDVPVIIVTGSIGEEKAVEILRSGAADYLLKDRLARLGQAVQRAMDERRLHREKRAAERALRLAEERMRFALEAARVGIFEADLQADVAHWSPTQEALHGLAPGTFQQTFEAFIGSIHPADRDRIRQEIQQAIGLRKDYDVLYRTQWRDGSVHWLRGIGRTFYDEAGTPLRAAGIATDMTEHRALEEQYRQSQKMEAIGQVAGGIAHDFNNLLTAIQGYGELLAGELGPESPHQADLAEIRRAATRAAALTRQLLAFGRRQILEPRVLDLRDSIRTMEPMLRRLIGEHIAVAVPATGTVGRVKADPGQVEQVILNLAINARDAMPDGGTLTIEVADVALDHVYAAQHAGARPGHYVMLAVSDTGVGMDEATRERIFEPFFTTKEPGKGTGLGLSTVYGIVKQSGGNIWVYSEPGLGSSFKVYLPRVDAPVDSPALPLAPDSLQGDESILVVEDEPSVRELVRRALVHHGYRVVVAETPREALLLADRQAGRLDLIISDVVLPQMSGSTLAAQLVAIQPSARVLYMSGYTDNALVHHGVRDERTPFLQKPFTPEALARKVREVLSERPARR